MMRSTMVKGALVLGVLGLGLAPTAGDVLAMDVAACGITIPTGATGTLVHDVTCGEVCASDPSIACDFVYDDWECPTGGWCVPDAIRLERNAKLDLDGHDLYAAYQAPAILCSEGEQRGRCVVRGPGTIFARKGRAVVGNVQDVVLRDLTIDKSYTGIETAGRVVLENVTTLGGDGRIYAARGVRARGLAMDSGMMLVTDGDMRVSDAEVAASLVAGGTLRGFDVVVLDGGFAGENVFLTRARGMDARSPSLSDWPPVGAVRKLVLRESLVGAIESGEKPRLESSTCVTSKRYGTAATWGVCPFD